MTLTGTQGELQTLSDTIVIILASKGELMAMEELVRRQQARVRQFMYGLCRHRDEADDLAQTVFLRLWQALPRLRTVEAYFGWQKQIMVNVWKESLRNQRLEFSDADPLEVQGGADDKQGLKHDLNAALLKLSPEKRLCVVLSYHEGLTHPEISAITGLAKGTVKSHITRGTALLRTMLASYGEQA